MRELKNVQVFVYDIDDGFRIDIVCEADKRSAYIYHKDYGVKDLMFATSAKQDTFDEFKEMVKANFPEHAAIYEKEYMGESL